MRLRVGNVARPEVTEELDFLVDSGAIYSVVPTEILSRLGVQPLAEQEFRLANGTRIVRKKGVAFFRYEDRVGGADVIFGERTVTRRTYLRALHVSSSNPCAAARAADHGGRPAVLPEFAGDLADFAGSWCAP